jgi:hypothetical protein
MNDNDNDTTEERLKRSTALPAQEVKSRWIKYYVDRWKLDPVVLAEAYDRAYSAGWFAGSEEIKRLKALLRRAANQMEAGWEPSGNLIKELRKTAAATAVVVQEGEAAVPEQAPTQGLGISYPDDYRYPEDTAGADDPDYCNPAWKSC